MDTRIEGKILVHGTEFVNSSLLYKGIYSTDHPEFFRGDFDIEQHLENVKGYVNGPYAENLRKCKLIPATLQIHI